MVHSAHRAREVQETEEVVTLGKAAFLQNPWLPSDPHTRALQKAVRTISVRAARNHEEHCVTLFQSLGLSVLAL